jgi:hypothetical protein
MTREERIDNFTFELIGDLNLVDFDKEKLLRLITSMIYFNILDNIEMIEYGFISGETKNIFLTYFKAKDIDWTDIDNSLESALGYMKTIISNLIEKL